MATTGSVAESTLTDEERETLQRWAQRAKSSQALAQRRRTVLGCAAGKSNKEGAGYLILSSRNGITMVSHLARHSGNPPLATGAQAKRSPFVLSLPSR